MERLTSIVEQIKASSALERERGLLALRLLLEGLIYYSTLHAVMQNHAFLELTPYDAGGSGASDDEQRAVQAHLIGRIPWLVQSEQWTHRLAALSLSKASPAIATSLA